MLKDFIDSVLSLLNLSVINDKQKISVNRKMNRYSTVKNATSPIEVNSQNVVYPDGRREREIEALYTEIRELQKQNREKAEKNRFLAAGY